MNPTSTTPSFAGPLFARRGSSVVSNTALATNIDVNVRDELGLTPLLHAVTNNNLQMVKLLLEHPKIDVNLKDLESGWTPLHRALYQGHLRIALALLAHKDIDVAVEDKDGYTATDIYLASTPSTLPQAPCPGDSLYTWGSNSNFTLGHNDGDDRAIPELVKFPYQTSTLSFPRVRAAKSQIYTVSMEKFHSTVATSETGLAVKIWGYGSGGRLGSDKKMQSRPSPVQGFTGQAALTALGRDHTIIVTNKGEVYTFGNNKYGQLGYAIDSPKAGQDPVQMAPKKVIQTIAKIRIIGAAASKWHTVVHSETELFSWGFNFGQLGYERKGDIQSTPRKVVSIPSGRVITQVAASDSATACLLTSGASTEVFVYFNFGYHRVSFPLFPYPDSFKDNYTTVMIGNKPSKIASCDNKFGAMTGWGDVFVWQYPEADTDVTLGTLPPTATSIYLHSSLGTGSGSGSGISIPYTPEPRRVWVYGGDRTKAVDFALGQNGAIILLTKGGHVYIGTNRGSSIGRNVKWRRIQHLDRIVQVQANSSGAWAAVRSEVPLKPIAVRPGSLARDLEHALTLNMLYHDREDQRRQETRKDDEDNEDKDFEEDPDIWRMDFPGWKHLIEHWDAMASRPRSDQDTPTRLLLSYPNGHCPPDHHLFDVDIQCGTRVLGAHRIILAARSPVLRRALVETPLVESKLGMLVSVHPILGQSPSNRLYRIQLHGVEFATAALLVQFLYSDRIDPFWDTLRLTTEEKTYAQKVRQQLYHLALELTLPTLQAALQYSFTHRCHLSMSGNLRQIVDDPQMFKGLEDVKIRLANGAKIASHQVVLAQRSPVFYATLAHTDVWTRERQSPRRLVADSGDTKSRMLELDLTHVDVETMRFVMQYIYTDCGPEMFDPVEKEDMVELIQIVVNVLQVADELMLYRLKDICEQVLGSQVRPKTLVSLLEISDIFSAAALQEVCLDYLCQNLESALDQKWLVGVDDDLLMTIEKALIARLVAESPFVRTVCYLTDEQEVEKMRQMLEKRAAFEAAMAIRDAEMGAARLQKARSIKELQTVLMQEKSSPESPTTIASPTVSPWTTVGGHGATSLKEDATLLSRETATLPSASTDTTDRRGERKPAGQSVSTVEWPSLGEKSVAASTPSGSVPSLSAFPTISATLQTEQSRQDLPRVSAPRKTGWDTLSPGMESADKFLTSIVGTGPVTPSPKPSLRDILEQEQSRQQQQQMSTPLGGGSQNAPKDKAVKLSQKERRKQQQQQAAAALAEATASSASRSSTAPAWGKVAVPSSTTSHGSTAAPSNAGIANGGPFVSTTSASRNNDESSEANGRYLPPVSTTSTYIFDPSPQALAALLEAQAHDLLLLSGGHAATPRSTDSSSGRGKGPLTVTASSPAVASSGMPKAPVTPLSVSSSSTAAKEAPWRRDAIPEPLWSITSPKDMGSGGGNIMADGLGSPLVRSSSSSSSFATPFQKSTGGGGLSTSNNASSPLSSVSAFARIQNQQLRDRNQLLLARQRKKPLFQIQAEEQAMAQLRLQTLDSIRSGAITGTGEWFSCELGP
ncbi:hypothetical protein BGZ73_004172 [Actinomortierella ambigua]|nr:hypothetical protein BGZ73_004172 [Actinomortierella ambigua]